MTSGMDLPETLRHLKAEYEALTAVDREGEVGKAIVSNIVLITGDIKNATSDFVKKRLDTIGIVDVAAPRDIKNPITCKEMITTLSDYCQTGRHAGLVFTAPPVHVLRSGNNRNLPCPCGSGSKFKKCCFHLETPITIRP